MASTYLTRTPSSTGNRKTWTISGWIKRCETSTSSLQIFSAGEYAVTDLVQIYTSSHKLYCGMYNSSGTEISSLITSRLFRDTNAFYHIVVAVDTTQATASNRVKIYINVVQETAFDTENYPTQNYDTAFNTTNQNTIGSVKGNTQYFDGIMSHVHLIDGTAYDASAFGEYDANGVWKINTSPSVTYGTNGFFILKNGNSVTDQSGNSNNWTVAGGTLTNTEDNPSNVFSVGNSLIPSLTTYSNGNLTVSNGASWKSSGSTIAVTQGKWYAEMKVDTFVAVGMFFGVEDMDLVNIWSPSYVGTSVNGRGYYYNGNVYSNATISSYGSSYTTGDIIGCALDMDNKFVYFSKNGVFQNSGDPTSGATGTGGLTLGGTTYCIAYAVYNSTVSLNFGNGYFGTTAVSSAQNPDDGIGIFEYDVPAGYKALCTKSINAQEYD